MTAVQEMTPAVGIAEACRSLYVPRGSFYRKQQGSNWKALIPKERPRPARALSDGERAQVLRVLHAPEFVDQSPAAIYAQLLDEDKQYLCSIRTMYRILEAAQEVRERRHQRRHPKVAVPRLVAHAPNQVWTWDITLLRGPEKWMFYYLYVILDLFSRYVVGWMAAEHQNGELAKRLIAETCRKEDIIPDQLKVHSDRGSPMKAKPLVALYAELGLTGSYSRPRVSNDNPFSEATFKTFKYRADYPGQFGSLWDVVSHFRPTMHWYNHEHRHSGLGYLTPAMVHHGRVSELLDSRRVVLAAAHAQHPDRFVNKAPEPLAPPREVWINRPTGQEIETEQLKGVFIQ
jgi:putative transposase